MRIFFLKNRYLYKHTFLLGVLCLFIALVHAQITPKQLRKEMLQSQTTPVKSASKAKKQKKYKPMPEPKPLAPQVNPLKNKNSTLVFLESSESLSSDKILLPGVQVVRGHVRFRHDNALLYCDSAYFYQGVNSLDAFGNVRIVQGDTLFVYGDVLYYDGNVKLARLRHNVRMVNRKTTLTTDSLNYDRITNMAYYYTGGRIVDPLNVLTSIWGQYCPSTNQAMFRNKVHLVNKNFTLDSDTLQYNTRTSVANIVGPSHIVYNKETDIFTNRGWYNTASERMMLLDRSLVKQKDGKTMVGDTIFYDKKIKFAEGFSRVVMNDTIQKMTLIGDYVNYNEKAEKGMATDSAFLVDWSTKDTMYVHADTLNTSKDSIYNLVRGHYNVRIFRNDLQGLCDSLTYNTRDSVLNMYHEPVLWKDNNQLSGDNISAFTKNKKVERVVIKGAAMGIQHIDTVYYNQMSGKEIIAHIDSGELKRVNINGTAETVYYPIDDKDSTIVGMNKTQSSFVVMYFKNKKIDRIVLTSASNGNMYPLEKLKSEDVYLRNFIWVEEQRPKKREDIFLRFPKTKREKPGNSSSRGGNDDKKGSPGNIKEKPNGAPTQPLNKPRSGPGKMRLNT